MNSSLYLDIPAPDLGAIAIKAAATLAGLEADAVVRGNAEQSGYLRHAESAPPPMRVTISPATAAARFRTPKSIDAGGAAADRFPRCGPDRPCCRRQSYPPDGARGYRLPESN